MSPDREPDAFAKGVRFGCGALAGAGLSGFVALQYLSERTSVLVATVVTIAVLFGVLALRYGDSFWDSLGEFLSDWWG